MPFYRPKSFLKLVLIGFAVVMLPLIVAIIDATIRVDRIAEQSQRTVSRAVQVLQGSRTLAEQATAMERYIKQFQVLGDESLFHAYVETHDRFQQVAHNLGAVVFSAIFVGMIARPIRQIDYAIQRLGAGEFGTAIQISGPHDLQYLGQRLNWLRGRLRQLEDEKRKFLQHVSHELKTPLTALREGTALLEEGVVGELNEAQHEIVEILEQNGTQLQKLIEDLLNFHLAEARLAALDLKPLQLDRMLEDVLNDHKLAMRAKDIEVQLLAPPVVVRGDREKLRVAIDNLVSNAVKYSPRGGSIRAALTHEAGNVILDIRDTGPGIADEDKPRVFEAFYQGAAAYAGHVKGSGLGLAIAREYVAAHHGQLEIVDDVSQGAHFRLTLPTSNHKETA